MKHGLLMLTAGVWLVSGAAGAHRGDVDVVLPVSPEIWGGGEKRRNSGLQPLLRLPESELLRRGGAENRR
ncbi:Uncharacterised protein [Serratia ficaria]|nr:Uncharacterised protein [Serratia ficaria]